MKIALLFYAVRGIGLNHRIWSFVFCISLICVLYFAFCLNLICGSVLQNAARGINLNHPIRERRRCQKFMAKASARLRSGIICAQCSICIATMHYMHYIEHTCEKPPWGVWGEPYTWNASQECELFNCVWSVCTFTSILKCVETISHEDTNPNFQTKVT